MKSQNNQNRAERRQAAQAVGRDHRSPRWFEMHLATEDQLGRISQLRDNSPNQMMVDPVTGRLFAVPGFSDLDPTSPDVPRP